MSTFGRIHFLRRQRRFSLGEFPSPSIGAFEDFESQRLDYGGPERGWAGPGVVYTYAALVAFENYETSTLNSTILPVFGWASGGVGTPPSFSVQPTASVGAMAGDNIIITATEINGAAPVTFQWQKNGVNLSNGGVVSGATTTTLTLTGISTGDYGSYTLIATDAASASATSTACVVTDITSDWVTRVVAAGGATPSGATQTALTTFMNGLVTDSIYTSMKGVCCFVPDSLIASITPLIKGTGISPWTNHSFVLGDLSLNGLKGNGSSKYLDTGILPNPTFASDNDGALTVYNYSASTSGIIDLGCEGSAFNVNSFHLYAPWSDGNIYSDIYGAGTGRIAVAYPAATGFVSSNRTASNAHAVYKGSSNFPHSTLVTGSGVSDQTRSSTRSVYCFGSNANGTPAGFSNRRMSFAAVHGGLSSGQSANLFTRVHQMRKDLHGGYVTLSGNDCVDDWALRVVANGGAAPSGGTVTALKTFMAGLATDAIDNKILSCNCFVPDSLTAAITPLISALVGAFNDPWTNTNFVGGDLTVNGLTGNGSNKWLNTGIKPIVAGTNNIGLAVMMPATGSNGAVMGSWDGAGATSRLTLSCKFSDTFFYSFDGANANLIGGTLSPGIGFYANNRTSSTDHRVWFAKTGSAFAQINATDTTSFTGTAVATNPMSVFAQNGNGANNSFCSDTLSFACFHFNMSSTDLSNLFNRVQTLRVALGGGSV